MTLPASFAAQGFLSIDKIRKRRRLMLGTDGPSNSGKTEFAISAPGPGIVLCLDRGFDSMLDNPNPPPSRRDDFAFKVISVPKATSATQPVFLEYWRDFYNEYKKALENPEARTVVIDGDSDSWELQRLAEFGKLTQIPPILYTSVNASRRAMIARAWDSGKIIISTNKTSHDYQPVLNADGSAKTGRDGNEVREWDGKTYKRQGFSDQDYLWQVQIRHLYEPAYTSTVTKKEVPQRWGLKIMKCKVDPLQEGTELWGPDCNFETLVSLIYPQVDLKAWGF